MTSPLPSPHPSPTPAPTPTPRGELELDRSSVAAQADRSRTVARALRPYSAIVRTVRRAQRHRSLYDQSIESGRHDALLAKRQHQEAELALAQQLPNSELKPRQRWLSLLFKLLLLAADTAVIGSLLWRAGLSVRAAAVAGLSVGLTLVACGAILGREIQARSQRRSRGPIPDRQAEQFRYLYLDRNLGRPWFWMIVDVGLAAAAIAAMTNLGVAVGDPFGLALATGIFAAFSIAGSAGAEAYGTNLAADRVDRRTKDLKRTDGALRKIAKLRAKADAGFERAELLHRGMIEGARARGARRIVSEDLSFEHPTLVRPAATEGRAA